MTICPVALAVGCVKCPVVKLCPLKEVLGDYKKQEESESKEEKESE